MTTTLAERVTEVIQVLKDRGFSVAQTAKAIGVTDKTIYQWMDGATKTIEGGNLVELAEFSGYNARWIANEKGPKFDTKSVLQGLKLLRAMTPARQADAVKIIAPFVEQDGGDEGDEHGEKAG
jgi:transcriptional regulator with XRE-family HTH domain